MYFKPSGARHVEQKHKFDIMGIPGVLAGYDLAPGIALVEKVSCLGIGRLVKAGIRHQCTDTQAEDPPLH